MSLVRIGFCGTHGTGKTTTRCLVVDELKEKYGKDAVRFTESITREVAKRGYEINKDANTDAESLMVSTLFDLLTCSGGDTFFLVDRTFVDMLAYSYLSKGVSEEFCILFKTLLPILMKQFDIVFFVPMEEHVPLKGDGIRLSDSEYQIAIDKKIREILSAGGIVHHIIKGTREERTQTCLSKIDDVFKFKNNLLDTFSDILSTEITPETEISIPIDISLL